MILGLIAFFYFNAWSDYSPLMKKLLEGQYDNFKNLAFEEIQSEKDVNKKREILKIIGKNKNKLYNMEAFRGEVLPYNNGKCVNDVETESLQLCSSFKEYDFLIENTIQEQNLVIRYKKQIINKLPTFRRSGLTEYKIEYGKAIHLIYDSQNSKTIFLLIREIETTQQNPRPLLHTINVYRLENKNICKLAESNITDDDSIYEYITEYIRAFGKSVSCAEVPLQL